MFSVDSTAEEGLSNSRPLEEREDTKKGGAAIADKYILVYRLLACNITKYLCCVLHARWLFASSLRHHRGEIVGVP